MKKKGFTAPKRGKREVAFETISRPFQHLGKGAKKGVVSKVGKSLS